MVAFIAIDRTETITAPSGWTSVRSDGTSGQQKSEAFVKIAGSSEPASYQFTTSGNAHIAATCASYRGATLPAHTHGGQEGNANPVTAPSVTTTVSGVIVLGHSVSNQVNFGSVSNGATKRTVANTTGFDSCLLSDEILSVAGATGTYEVTHDGSAGEEWVGQTVALATANAAPNAPSLTYPTGSTTIDKDAANRFTWDFSDPDSGDTQSAYDLRYKLTTDSTWTVVSGGANEYHDFAAGTFTAGDWEWQVRTTDNGGLTGPYSASEFFTAAASPPAPSISDPINGGTVNTDPYTVEWTHSDQDAYQVRTVADDGAGNPDTATVYQDTGEVVSASLRAHSIDFPVNNRDEHVQVRVKNDGLWSSWASVKVTVSYTPPATPTSALTAADATATITITIDNPTPGAGEPTVTSNEIELRTTAGTDDHIGTTGTRVATGVANDGTYVYRAPASGVTYEARITAIGDNGTKTTGAWTA